MRELTAIEARVLGVLVEKQATVPDTYPLSLNALVAGCNQKTARDPVMSIGEQDALAALEGLRALSLVFESSGARVARYEHNAARGLGVASQAAALLAMLVLRGPQTAAELRANSERLHRFADTGSVEAFLDELADKTPPRALKLARVPGEREARWAHLLCGEPVLPAVTSLPRAANQAATDADELGELRAELRQLRALVHRIAAALDVDPDPPANDDEPR